MGEQQAPPRILGAVYADDDVAAVEQAHRKVTAGLELTEEERERVLAAMRSLTPVFEQMTRAFADMARALGPLLQQVARSFASIRQDDFELAPPRPGEPRRRGPGRRGREAQRSPYGPQGRR